ncbi:MAG: hypothetical protein ACLPVY_04715, partial [Acidimicrobiia bacterium]
SFDNRLLGSNDLGPMHASQLAAVTNHLSTVSQGSGGACPAIPPTFFVTFASQAQRVSIASWEACIGPRSLEPRSRLSKLYSQSCTLTGRIGTIFLDRPCT